MAHREECIRYGLADRYAEQDADMTQAAEVLKKANLDVEQRIKLQRSLAAQLRQLTRLRRAGLAMGREATRF